jgi:hypothetical protein
MKRVVLLVFLATMIVSQAPLFGDLIEPRVLPPRPERTSTVAEWKRWVHDAFRAEIEYLSKFGATRKQFRYIGPNNPAYLEATRRFHPKVVEASVGPLTGERYHLVFRGDSIKTLGPVSFQNDDADPPPGQAWVLDGSIFDGGNERKTITYVEVREAMNGRRFLMWLTFPR